MPAPPPSALIFRSWGWSQASAAATWSELLAAAQQLVAQLGIDYMTVTMSEKGIRILYPDAVFHSPTRAREVFDVTGAGDTVIATLAASLAAGLDPETAVTLANIAAGIVVAKTGTAPISRNELVAEFTASTQMKGPDKILDLEHLLVRLAEWRANGDRIVFTNGCFDILHVGHITLLEQCREFGDKVVIGVNSDASVKATEGPHTARGRRKGASARSGCAGLDRRGRSSSTRRRRWS